MKQSTSRSLVVVSLLILGQSLRAGPGIAYPDPPGGWQYIYLGDAASPGTASAAFDALDGTWNYINGSSEWDGSVIGGTISTNNKPGGAMTWTEADPVHPGTNVTFLRVQDCGNPSQYGYSAPSNRKLMFGHDMMAEGCPDNVLDGGFTCTFRARVPTRAKTTGPVDPLYPSGESSSGPQPYPAGGDGYLVMDNAYGLVSMRQLGGGKLGLSLVVSNDTTGGLNTTPKANAQGLELNGLNGATLNNNIDWSEVTPQYLPLDPTDWNEFWIVVQSDLSGLGTHIALVYTNGSLTPQVYHFTAASASGEYSGVSSIQIGMSQTGQMGAMDLDFLAYRFDATYPPGAGGAPPTITTVLPTPLPSGNLFWPTAQGISFAASASGGKTIPTSGILLVLSGTNVSSGLDISGPSSADRYVTYNHLAANTLYTGQISVTDSGGATATFPLLFDTFTESSAVVIEAEDYNYDSGQFKDNPAPGDYAAFTGTPEVDFHDVTPSTLGLYRSDAVDTTASTDTLRDKFGGGYDFDVGLVEQGEWQNYRRTFPDGKYNVYLRYASQAAQQVRLDRVIGDRTQPNQATASLGTFSVANNGAVYTYARLSDALGNPLVLNLSGVQTLRLTAPQASINLQLNYLVFAPAGAVTNPPVVGYSAPAPNSTTLLPDAPILISIVNRDTAVVTNTINFKFDGNDVTALSTITSTAAGASIVYQPPTQLTLGSTHTNRLIFSDNGTPARNFTNQWTFKVANLPVLLAAWATPLGSGVSNGFNVQIHWHAAGQDLLFVNNATRGEDQVGMLLNDAATGQPYVNDAAGPNGDGTYSETGVINYSGDGTDQGLFPGDQVFPYVDPPSPQPDHIAMAVTANVELTAGLHRFGVRREAGFKLSAGPAFTRAGATLPLGLFETANNAPGTATTEFDFMVQANGVYPVRLIYFENSGVCNVEWYSVDRNTGAATLINKPADPASVKAYMSRTVVPLTAQTILRPQIVGTNLTFQYPTLVGFTYYVDYKGAVNDSWTLAPTGFAGDGTTNTFSTPANAATKRFYRVRAQ